MSWLFLMALIFLPWLSLLLSLPSMISQKGTLIAPNAVSLGNEISLSVRFHSKFPLTLVSWKFQIQQPNTTELTRINAWDKITAEHCGCIKVELANAWKYDFLGLFRWRLCKKSTHRILVYPKEVPIENIPSLKKILIPRWKAKRSGIAENYELRDYQPGDSLRQIHWKLSAKTGRIIFREAIIPIRNTPVLTMILSGDANEFDEKLGKFKFLSQYLLQNNLPHEMHCLSGEGLKIYRISNQHDLHQAITQMLLSSLTTQKNIPYVRAVWKYHIGGEQDEA